MKKKKRAVKSTTEKIMEISNFLKTQRTAEEIKKEIKDNLGYSIKIRAIRYSLLRLLRRKKIERKKDGKLYRYHI